MLRQGKRKRKLKSSVESQTKRARRAYGKEAVDVVPDISTKELEERSAEFLDKHINISEQKCSEVESNTKDQSNSALWKKERRMRLTASSFGEIFKRNPSLKCKPIIQRLLYSNFRGNRYTIFGLQAETSAIKEYIQMKKEEGVNVNVQKSGLNIDREKKFLGASPDGKVVCADWSQGLLEIKSVLQKNTMFFEEACKKQQDFCLESDGKGKLRIKKNHRFYYQCQGQMNACKIPWLDFVVRRENPYQIHVERIERGLCPLVFSDGPQINSVLHESSAT